MQALFDDPMVQSGAAPFVAALFAGFVLRHTRFAWLAVAMAVATTAALTAGIGFTPLTASRKVLLLVLLAPVAGLLLDGMTIARERAAHALGALCAAASVWVYWSVLSQLETGRMFALAAGVALFVGLLVALALRLHDDGAAGGGATIGLGFGVGVAALLSASIGNFSSGIALAAAGGALVLLQFVIGRALAPGYLGMLTVGLAAALYASTTFMLAQLPWFVMALLPLVPLAAGLRLAAKQRWRARLVATTLFSTAVSTAAMLAAWLATRSSASP